MRGLLLTASLVLATSVFASEESFGLMRVRASNGFDHSYGVAIARFSTHTFPRKSSSSGPMLVLAEPADGCTPLTTPMTSNTLAMVRRGNCTFADKALSIFNAGESALFLCAWGFQFVYD